MMMFIFIPLIPIILEMTDDSFQQLPSVTSGLQYSEGYSVSCDLKAAQRIIKMLHNESAAKLSESIGFKSKTAQDAFEDLVKSGKWYR